MKRKIEQIRAHHGMCFCFFKGKGYSSDFTDNMWDALAYLGEENPEVEIIDWDDSVCASCPNLLSRQERTAEMIPRQKEAAGTVSGQEGAAEMDSRQKGAAGTDSRQKETAGTVSGQEGPAEMISQQKGAAGTVYRQKECISAGDKLFACVSARKVSYYDQSVLEVCGLRSGDRMHWKDYQALVQEKIIKAGKREMICGDCSWNELCK